MKLILLKRITQIFSSRLEQFRFLAAVLPTGTDICSCNICIHHIHVDYVSKGRELEGKLYNPSQNNNRTKKSVLKGAMDF